MGECQLCWYSAAYPAPDGSRTRESRSSLDVLIRYDRETKALGEKIVYVVGMGGGFACQQVRGGFVEFDGKPG